MKKIGKRLHNFSPKARLQSCCARSLLPLSTPSHDVRRFQHDFIKLCLTFKLNGDVHYKISQLATPQSRWLTPAPGAQLVHRAPLQIRISGIFNQKFRHYAWNKMKTERHGVDIFAFRHKKWWWRGWHGASRKSCELAEPRWRGCHFCIMAWYMRRGRWRINDVEWFGAAPIYALPL